LLAIPAGSAAGLLAAFVLTFGKIGQLPILTVPAGIVATMIYALRPSIEPARRIKVLLIMTGAGILLSLLIP
jgi:hypothetical protein